VTYLKTMDLDGDGLPELCFLHRTDLFRYRFHALRGGPPVAWQRFGKWQPAADFDGDGTTDLLSIGAQQMAAISGRDGRLLWQVPWRLGDQSPLAFADLDGDGRPDVVVSGHSRGPNTAPLRAFSGKDGRQLWEVSRLDSGKERFGRGQFVACHDLEGHGRPDVIFIYQAEQA